MSYQSSSSTPVVGYERITSISSCWGLMRPQGEPDGSVREYGQVDLHQRDSDLAPVRICRLAANLVPHLALADRDRDVIEVACDVRVERWAALVAPGRCLEVVGLRSAGHVHAPW